MDKTENKKPNEEEKSDAPSESDAPSVGVGADGTNGKSFRKRPLSGDGLESSADGDLAASACKISNSSQNKGDENELKEAATSCKAVVSGASDGEPDAVGSSTNPQGEPGPKPQSDWWSPELTTLRLACVAARRRYTRHRRLRIRPPDTVAREAELYEGYKTAKLALKFAIIKAKELVQGKVETESASAE